MESTLKINLDMSGFKQVEKACKALSRTVEVGILHNPEEARIGRLQHDGGEGRYYYGPFEGLPVDVPPRPFIYAPVEHFGKTILEKGAKMHFDFTEKGAENTLNAVGHTMAEDIKYWMENSQVYPPRNCWMTIETKGFDHPLIDKGNLKRSIEYEVIK